MLTAPPAFFPNSEELRRRFLKSETTLFRLRFESDDAEEKQNFLKALQLDWTIVSPPPSTELTRLPPSRRPQLSLALLTRIISNFQSFQVSAEEKAALQAELVSTTPSLASTWSKEIFFKVPWTLVPDLVSRRMVYLKGGLAYVPQKEQMSLVLQTFRERLERGLEVRRLVASRSSAVYRSSLHH